MSVLARSNFSSKVIQYPCMARFQTFGEESTACKHTYSTDGFVEFRSKKIVALLGDRVVEAIENPQIDRVYFLVDVIFTGVHAHYILVDKHCEEWHEVVGRFGRQDGYLLKDNDDDLCFDEHDQRAIRRAIEDFCV